MSDFKTTPETDLTTYELLNRYQIEDEYLLHSWAKIHGINGNRSTFSPREVDLIDHAHHHLSNLGMSVPEYQDLVNRRHQNHPPLKVAPEPSNSGYLNATSSQNTSEFSPTIVPSDSPESDEDMSQQATDAIETLMDQYSEAIEYMGEQIADNFIEELDASVMRHLVRKVKVRQQHQAQNIKPNRLMKAIQVVFKNKEESLLAPSSGEESRLEMENTHRLG